MAIRALRPNEARYASPTPHTPALTASSHLRERLWNFLPITLSVGIVSTIFWGPYYAPWFIAIGIIAFFTYWLIRSYAVAVSCGIGLRRIKKWEKTNWAAKYCAWLPGQTDSQEWAWPRHMVIIPNYKESETSLARTLDSLAAQANANQLVIVMAMEARESTARAKAARLVMRYRTNFSDMFATYHPAGLPSETPGKGSNEAWAAREAQIRLIDHAGLDIERFTLTSCDADAVFHERHFEALNYLFLTNANRYRTFWQPTIFNSNNIWDIPAPLRIPDGLSGINRLSNLIMPGSVKFPTSCYSVSWKMLTEVDYWDEEVIPEDWHVYLKCCFTLGDAVHVESLFLPLGNDCVLADGYLKTLKAHYTQSVRHAWGASDIPYAWRAAFTHKSALGKKRRFLLAGAVTKVHALWMAQWYIVTLGVLLPAKMSGSFGAPMPYWWTHTRGYPGLGWHPENLIHPFSWMNFSGQGLVEGTMYLNFAGLLIAVCIFPLIAMIIIEFKTRPTRPEYVSRWALVGQFTMWPLMAVITFAFASMPALHAQWKLASGKGLIYHVAEKGTRKSHAAIALIPETSSDAIGAVGGK
ncbi:MAG: hypothetical protein ABI305_09150 [Tepidiformaceae bacterium]